jgi:hypothetical protein
MLAINNNGFKVWWDHCERIIGPYDTFCKQRCWDLIERELGHTSHNY